MGILDPIAGQIYAAFRGKLKAATLWRAVPSVSAGLDGTGDPINPVPTTWPCEGFTDNYSDYFTTRGEVPEKDVKVMIFAASLPAGVRPETDDKVQIPARTGPWYQLRNAKTDPATALWTCQAFETEAPQ